MQLMGYLVVAPLLCFAHAFTDRSAAVALPPNRAKSLLPALLVAYAVPAVSLFRPSLTPHERQGWMTLWQVWPVTLWAASALLARVMPADGSDLPSLRRLYAIMFVAGIAVQATLVQYVVGNTGGWEEALRVVQAVFVPEPLTATLTTPAKDLAHAAVSGLRWDFFLGMIASLPWVVGNVWEVVDGWKAKAKIFGLVSLGFVVLGPAATTAAVSAWREEKLRDTSFARKVKKM